MPIKFKPVRDQVIVVTGGSSGIGLETARLAAKRGAKVVLASRNAGALERAAAEITASGPGEATYVVADVGRREDIESVAQAAIERFGGFDTWVNNAGVGIWGRLEQVTDADNRRLFDTNFWGVVYGSMAAAAHLKTRGGAIINLGSVESDIVFPLQGVYAASKHAVKGFSDVLRLELEEEGAPVTVTVIKPAGIATPMPQHMKNYMGHAGQWAPPVYKPVDVAEAILFAAEHGSRDLYVGSAAKAFSFMNKVAPRLVDKYSEAVNFKAQVRDEPARADGDNLHQAGPDGAVYGDHHTRLVRRSVYTWAETHPAAAAGLAIAGVLIALGVLYASAADRAMRGGSREREK